MFVLNHHPRLLLLFFGLRAFVLASPCPSMVLLSDLGVAGVFSSELSSHAISWEGPILNIQPKVAPLTLCYSLCYCPVLIFSLYLSKYLKLLYLCSLIVTWTTNYEIERSRRGGTMSALFITVSPGLRTLKVWLFENEQEGCLVVFCFWL